MPLNLPPKSFKDITPLVIAYNNAPEDDKIQKLFYLQKINYLLNKTQLNDDLFDWINDAEEGGWLNELAKFSINPNASFFLKGMQFAKAITEEIKNKPEINSSEVNIYQLMQERDQLLKEVEFEKCATRYAEINFLLNELALNDKKTKEIVERQTEILRLVAPKIKAIKGESIDNLPVIPAYQTKELGNHVNNFNFKFTMSGWDAPFVFRVEDRHELGKEQELHSYGVSKYFIEDYSVFMMRFKAEDGSTVYKPVILSQFANQNNLEEIAKQLKDGSPKNIAPRIGYYFVQLTDFCLKLIETHNYHPDIKLNNFLVHNNRVLVSDRKTFTTSDNPLASDILTSPLFAPDEFLKCLLFNKEGDPVGYNRNALWKRMNMPQFMAYQLGMALKQFLILTQLDELPDDFRNPDHSAVSHFKTPSRQIINLSLLVQELTRLDPDKRMTIKQFQTLLNFKNLPPDAFYQKVEEVFPSSQLGIAEDIEALNKVLNSDLKGEALLKQANPVFTKLSKYDPKETRLTRLAEKLAIRCFNNVSKPYFQKLSGLIESTLEKDVNEIRQLLNPQSNSEGLLQKASPIFMKLFERQPEVPQLTDLAKQLAAQCFDESSKNYFTRQLPLLVEEELLNQDWEQAPWYRKALHWLTFGYFRVDNVTEISSLKIPEHAKGKEFQIYFSQLLFLPNEEIKNMFTSKDSQTVDFLLGYIEKERERREMETPSVKIPVDLKGEEFQMHFPQLEFLPSKDFESIGEKEGEHLECFIFANLQEILSHNNSDSSEKNSTSEPTDSESEIDLNVGNAAGTIIIADEPNPAETKPKKNDNDGIKQSNPAKTSPKGKVSTPEVDEHPKKKTKDDDTPKLKTKRSVHFFDEAKKSKPKEKENASPAVDETPRAKRKNVCRIDSVRSTLFRGDGSHRQKFKEQRPRLSEIAWEPPKPNLQ
ncbi:TPA: Dot/Icm T4SS effector kinase LegK7 [Legionella pneumophila]|uniref:Dot/Icm T4SS effector kinase LegK7 n=1 Tax=Legionella pneumophila TaxID=446 RepID=UPI001C16E147|nr:lpg1924 family Dot/Icm T4SS effector [Legionella pneumophila]